MLLRRDFSRVFAQGFRCQEGPLMAICLANSQGHPRLGLALRRKTLPRAVDRNRIKRLAREAFRRDCLGLPALDIVISAQSRSANQTRFQLAAHLARLLTSLVSWQQGERSPRSL
ncbi:RNase P protein component [Gammaproteobacteria bacterium]